MIPRACIVCGERAVAGRSRCSRHGPKTPARQGPNDYGWQWQQLREQAKPLLPMRCGICHLPISPGQPYALDHIKPKSMGGQDTIENVQWAHRSCNIAKGGRNRLHVK